MFLIRSQVATLQSRIKSVRVDIMSILDQVSVISSQTLKPTVLNPTDLKHLLAKIEDQLKSYPHLPTPQWKGINIWYMYKFMKCQSCMLSNTLYVVLHIPLVNKSLQFSLYRIHNILLAYLVLKKPFKYSIQEEYLAIRSDLQYMSFPLRPDLKACQISNRQFCCINSCLYTADASISCHYTLFLNDEARINHICILSVINQTYNEAININENFGAISTLQDDKKCT